MRLFEVSKREPPQDSSVLSVKMALSRYVVRISHYRRSIPCVLGLHWHWSLWLEILDVISFNVSRPGCKLTYNSFGSTPCTQEEKLALSFFLEKTALYMAENGGPGRTHAFWTTVLPRAFHTVPATRHLITAIGLMESCIGVPDAMILTSRCQAIHRNYSLALTNLMKPDLHPADLAFAPLLAWLLETLMLHDDQAEVHANAIVRLLSSPAFDNERLRNTELSTKELEYIVSCVQRTQSVREKRNVDAPLEHVLAFRSLYYRKVTPQEMLQAFKHYYETFDPPGMTLAQLRDAGAFVQQQTVAVHSNVYRSGEPMVISSAIAYLCNLSLAVLPQWDPTTEKDSKTYSVGLDFILEQFEDMATRRLAKGTDQALLNDVLSLALRVMRQYTPAEWRAGRSERLAQVVLHNRQRAAEVQGHTFGLLQSQAG